LSPLDPTNHFIIIRSSAILRFNLIRPHTESYHAEFKVLPETDPTDKIAIK
jgi:hypothetical protein